MGLFSSIGDIVGGVADVATDFLGSTAGAVTSSLVGSGLSYLSSKDANNKAGDTNADTLQLQADIYNQGREDFAPYQQAGTDALPAFYAMLGIQPQFSKDEMSARTQVSAWVKANPGVPTSELWDSRPDLKETYFAAEEKALFQKEIAASGYGGDAPNLSPLAKWQSQEFNKSQNRQDAARGLSGSGGASARVAEGNMAIAGQDYQNSYARILDALKLGTGASSSAGASSGVFSNAAGNAGSNAMGLALDQGNTNSQLWQGLGSIPSQVNSLNTPNNNTSVPSGGLDPYASSSYTPSNNFANIDFGSM